MLTNVFGFYKQAVIAEITAGKLTQAGGYRYRKARRPDLYKDIIGKAQSRRLFGWI